MSVPNQRVIFTDKETTKDVLYYSIRMENLEKAVKELKKPGAIKLFLYFSKNMSGYRWELSGKHFEEWANVASNTYTSAFADLVKKGYLVESKEGSNVYYFFDNLERAKQKKIELRTAQMEAERKEAERKVQEEIENKSNGFVF